MSQTVSEKRTMTVFSFVDIVLEYDQEYSSEGPQQRCLRLPTGVEFPWIMVSYDGVPVPEQGWKLHLSANESTAEAVLRRALPVLLARRATFKVIASQDYLANLNSGQAGLSQIGKFLTVYPADDQEAVELAAALDECTFGLLAPRIPSDRPLRPGSLVFYRYGGFRSQTMQTAWGSYQLMLRTPEQELVADQRTSSYAPPAWAVDPFLAAGLAAELPASRLFLADRYLLLTTLYQSAQSQVQLAADLAEGRRCIVKRPGLSFTRGLAQENEQVHHRLQREAEALQALAPHPGFPAFYELIEEEHEPLLIIEDMEGETLETYMVRQRARGLRTSLEQILIWGKELAALLAVVHDKGWIHKDLKTINVMIAPDNHLRLFDFGLARKIGVEDQAPGGGTFGYMSPQQESGEPATVQDDIYALGALLYFLATGAEPSVAPREKPLTARPLHLLNPALPAALIAAIERCLAPEPSARFSSALEVEAALSALQQQPGEPFRVSNQAEERPLGAEETEKHYLDLARRLGETLCRAAQPDPEGNGLRWTSTRYLGKGMRARDLDAGNAGSLLALAELSKVFDDSEMRRVLAEGARWLAASQRLPGEPLPGLYVGESGVGAALLRAGQVLNDPALISLAVERGRWIATLPFRSPDLFNGTAGRARFLLWLWNATNDSSLLPLITQAGEWLVANAEEVNEQELCWRIPAGYGGMSEQVYPGYAHGAAGIADVLLDLYEVTRQESFLITALRAATWLQRLAIPVLSNQSGLDWPVTPGKEAHGAYWCHGATGIGIFFLHLAQLNVFPEAMAIAQRAALTVAHGNRACGPVQCHGLAGNIDFLLDMAQEREDEPYRGWAYELAVLLEAFAREQDGLLVWSSESPLTVTPDYQGGYAGIAMTLLRLGNAHRTRLLARSYAQQ